MKRRIKKDEFEKLSADMKAEYESDKGDKDGGYRLKLEDLDDDDDPVELRRGKQRETEEAKKAREDLKKANDELDSLRGLDAKKRGDIDALDTSWKEKNKALKAEHKEQLSKLQSQLQTHLVDNVAISLATKIANPKVPGSVDLLLPHIKARLAAEFPDNGDPLTRILDKDKKPSALTPDELGKEFLANATFAAIVTGSKASGGTGSLPNSNGGTGNGFGNQGSKPVDLSKLLPADLASQLKAKKESEATQ